MATPPGDIADIILNPTGRVTRYIPSQRAAGQRPPIPLSPGMEWVFSKITTPLFADPVVAQLNTTVAANATVTLTINTQTKQWRVPINDDFGDVTGGVFNVSAQWDDIHTIGPILATNDIVANGLTSRLINFMGPVRTKIIYTFANTTAISQKLQFTSWGFNIPESLGARILGTVANDLDAIGIKVIEAQFPDVIRGGL